MKNTTSPRTTIPSRENLTATLFLLANDFAHLASEESEQLNYEQHVNLCEYEAKFLDFGNLLAARNQRRFLADELAAATEYLNDIRQRLGLSDVPLFTRQ